MDSRESLIRQLLLELRAERETRAAIMDAALAGADTIVLDAIASDPIPVEALAEYENFETKQPITGHL